VPPENSLVVRQQLAIDNVLVRSKYESVEWRGCVLSLWEPGCARRRPECCFQKAPCSDWNRTLL